MRYELALELKNNGFVSKADFKPYSRFFCPHSIEERKMAHVPNCPEAIYFPDLEELIEACGEEFAGLDYCGENYMSSKATRNAQGIRVYGGWEAKSREEPEERYMWEWGKTPREAVARLWLILNKK